MLRLGQARQGSEHLQFAGAQQGRLPLAGGPQQVPAVRQPQVQPGPETGVSKVRSRQVMSD